jgi:hypothetical protein
MFVNVRLQLEMFLFPPLDPILRSELKLERFSRGGPNEEMQISDSLTLKTKFKTLWTVFNLERN